MENYGTYVLGTATLLCMLYVLGYFSKRVRIFYARSLKGSTLGDGWNVLNDLLSNENKIEFKHLSDKAKLIVEFIIVHGTVHIMIIGFISLFCIVVWPVVILYLTVLLLLYLQ